MSQRTYVASLLLVFAGGVLAHPSRAKQPVQDGDSHYLAAIWKNGPEVDRMTPRLLTPKATEEHAPPRENCLAVTSKDGYKSCILPYIRSVGTIALAPLAAKNKLARRITQSLDEAWAALTKEANGKPGANRVLRILTKHYPRKDLPGRCFTLHVTFFTVRDPYFDESDDLAAVLERTRGKPVAGTMFELRKTYRMEDGKRRLIEGGIEVSPNVQARIQRRGFAEASKNDLARRFVDVFHGAHFQLYGGGTRHGFAWYDLSLGSGPVKEWSTAYTIERNTDGPEQIETEDVDPAVLDAVLEILKLA
ncbi:MAG: hypothetical protein V3T86_15245 [Planctomycetota bacterium]